MRTYCVVTNHKKDVDYALTRSIERMLVSEGINIINIKAGDDVDSYSAYDDLPDNVECAVVLGGDGTIMHAAPKLSEKNIPVFGINIGTLGFLTEVEKNQAEYGISRLLKGEYTVENRIMLDVFKDGRKLSTVLNDSVISRSGYSRVVSIEVSVNGDVAQKINGDGVIISTPTGSTGYSLSAGGAVVKPDSELILITPVCTHSLSARGMIISDKDEIAVKVIDTGKPQMDKLIVTNDGGEVCTLIPNDKIVIKKSEICTRLIKLNDRTFFDVLRTKLGTADCRY